jgi:hypothetical protein
VVEVGMVAHAAVTGKRQDRMFCTGLAVVAAAIVFYNGERKEQS